MNFPSKKRESLVISISILKAASKGIRKTHLISSVSLSYELFTKYIQFLKVHGFIEEHNGFYQTTEKGLELIKELDSSMLIRSVLATWHYTLDTTQFSLFSLWNRNETKFPSSNSQTFYRFHRKKNSQYHFSKVSSITQCNVSHGTFVNYKFSFEILILSSQIKYSIVPDF